MFYHLFLHLIQIIHPYITQLRIPLKSRKREIILQDLKAPSLLTVSDNPLTLKNSRLKWNLAVCCNSSLLSREYTFKNVNKTFTLNTLLFCNSFNVIYVVIRSSCLEEHVGGKDVGKTRLRDRVVIYRKHIKQPEHQKAKVKEHIRIRGRGPFKIFPFVQMRLNDTNSRRAYETSFKQNIKLNSMTH